MKIPRTLKLGVSFAALSVLAGCGDGGVQEVRDWMTEVRAQTPVSVQKLSEPKKFEPFTYSGKNEFDPFNSTKLSVALAKINAKSTGGIKPDMDRRKEPLESYPLDAIKMVGTLEKPGLSYALLQVDKVVFQAKVGNYIGQNFGMITRITDTEVEIKEIVRDPSGEWTERKAKLELQENKK
ncbi:pilus assembly protein PilP [Noviherbaspirillum denitrificans]|uniref:Pilus assembly protein PilP n=1 Tax=Noviherbaspirillum denitrificans TaxID=1968433 RepID=A0A254TI61_9BURK|nr:pilus assembly protein PilP [Noviherbaspirillum denitrificans]OWW22330.1 pilus assembly protein PilP [Noviherbaspirillum denitrificans]